MFNVCPHCGQYSPAKQVLFSPARVVCPECSQEHIFTALPLFVVTGASASGKTTAALELARSEKNFVVLDQDILWASTFDVAEGDYVEFRNTWLRMVKNIHQAGKSVVLFGSAIPAQFESCTERRYLSAIHYLALVCDPIDLKNRLLARPAWRKAGSDENIKTMLEFNQWLIDNVASTEPNIALLNTSNATVEQTTGAIENWLYGICGSGGS